MSAKHKDYAKGIGLSVLLGAYITTVIAVLRAIRNGTFV